MKRRLSVSQAVEAACILFDLNTKEQSVVLMAQRAGLPCSTQEEKTKLLWEWRAYVHAAVLYGLMVQAPNIVVVEYLRVTQAMLHELGYSSSEAESFIDGAFRAYTDPMVHTRVKDCPGIFFKRLMEQSLDSLPAHTVAMISGVMAMVVSAVLDKWEQYDFALE
jgi:hypothetical protein